MSQWDSAPPRRRVFLRRLLLSVPLFAAASAARASGPEFDRDDERRKERERKRLGITRVQQHLIAEHYKETDRERREIRKRLEQRERDLRRVYAVFDYDRQRANALMEEINDLRRRSMQLYANSEERLRRILTREQFQRLRRNDDDDDD